MRELSRVERAALDLVTAQGAGNHLALKPLQEALRTAVCEQQVEMAAERAEAYRSYVRISVSAEDSDGDRLPLRLVDAPDTVRYARHDGLDSYPRVAGAWVACEVFVAAVLVKDPTHGDD